MSKVEKDVTNLFTYEMTEDLEFTKMAYYETMRLDTPFDLSSTETVTAPCTISGIDLVPGDAFLVNMGAIHMDKA